MAVSNSVLSSAVPAAPCFSPDEVAAFQEQGYLIVRQMAPAALVRRMHEVTLEGLERAIAPVEYEADLRYPGAPESHDVRGGRTIRRLKQALSRDYAFIEWVQHPNVVNRLRQVLGPTVFCPLAHHNCIMTKAPEFSSVTGWHQDLRYWSFQKPDLVNVWLALGPERPENGCLQVIPGTHRMSFRPERFDKDLFLRDDLPENQELIAQAIHADLEPGDVLFFHCRTFHAAGRNLTGDTKYSVVMTFRGTDNAPIPGSRSASLPELLLHGEANP